jgi:hypothetical protein
MGYLDQLKQQADAVLREKQVDAAAFERSALAVEAACKTCFHYWLDLSRQLDVLKPPVPTRYAFDNRNVLDGPADGLRFQDWSVDARRRSLRNLEVYDHVVLSARVRSGRRLTLTRNFPPDMERLEARLTQAAVVVVPDVQRDLQTGRFKEAVYAFDADVHASVRLTPDHAQGRLQFAAVNLEGLSTLTVKFDAARVDTALLDELAKWWLGEPSGFVAAGRVVRRHEPR